MGRPLRQGSDPIVQTPPGSKRHPEFGPADDRRPVTTEPQTMVTPDVTRDDRDPALQEYPSFEFEYYFDDHESPTTITICSTESSGSLATEWISIRASHAYPLEAIR